MTEPRYRIKGWDQFQHFKDRTPPWVKLYRTLLDDPDWHDLDGEHAKVLVMLWLLASEDESKTGLLPCTRKLAFRLRMTESKLKQALTKLSHWLEQIDITTISQRYHGDAPETETETYKPETETDSAKRGSKRCPEDFALTHEMREWAAQETPKVRIDFETAAFRDHTFTKARSDWPATWRNWMREASRRAPRSVPSDGKYAEVIAGLTGRRGADVGSANGGRREVDMGDVVDVPTRLVG